MRISGLSAGRDTSLESSQYSRLVVEDEKTESGIDIAIIKVDLILPRKINIKIYPLLFLQSFLNSAHITFTGVSFPFPF